MAKVSIYTPVYNTKIFLERCIESVLNQSFKDFEYILIDNASTDGCKEILEAYAARDKRIQLIRYEKNIPAIWLKVAKETCTGRYITEIDSDDWLEPFYLERLLYLAEQQQLDITCTGTAFHMEGQEKTISGTRNLSQQLFIQKSEYANFFPLYHAFFRTVWGKLLRKEIFFSADLSIIDREGVINGSDTLSAFAWLRQAKRIGIDNLVLHHYLMRKKSISHIYLPNRFKSNTVLYQDAIDFLSQYGSISERNRRFLSCVYGNAIQDTLEVINNSQMKPFEKLNELKDIVSNPITLSTFQYAESELSIKQNKELFLKAALIYGKQCLDSTKTFQTALESLCPNTGFIITPENSLLFLSQQTVFEALLDDNAERLQCLILDMVSKNQNTKQYDLGKLLQSLTPERSLAHQVDDVRFIRKYRTIYENLCREDYISALDEMTELLLNNKKIYNEEFFLNIYISAAALMKQVPAFLFGKTQLAAFYLQQRRREDCQAVLKELDEMGVESEEIAELRRSSKTVIV